MATNIENLSENIEVDPKDIALTPKTSESQIEALDTVPASDSLCTSDNENDQINPTIDVNEMENVENRCYDNKIEIDKNETVSEERIFERESIEMQNSAIVQNENTNSAQGTCNDQTPESMTDVVDEPNKNLQSKFDDLKQKSDEPVPSETESSTKSNKSSYTSQSDDDDSDDDIYVFFYPQETKKEGELSIYASTECQAYIYDVADNEKDDLQTTVISEAPPPVPTAPRPYIDELKQFHENVYDEVDYLDTQHQLQSSNKVVVPPAVPTSPRPFCKYKLSNTTEEMLKPLRIIDSSISENIVTNTLFDGEGSVLLDGVPKDITIKEIDVSIETDLLSNSEDLETILLHRTLGEAIVTLKSVAVADELVKRSKSGETFFLKDSSVSILPYRKSSYDSSKIFILGQKKESSTEELSNLIQAICGVQPLCVIKGREPTVVLLEFKTPEDLTQFQDKLRHSKGDKKLDTFPVERTKKVRVRDETMTTTPEEMIHYFSLLSQSGTVLSVKHRDEWKDYIVTFSDPEDADIVVSKGPHNIKNADVQVSLYYPLLDEEEECYVNIPVPFKLNGLNTYICRFLQMSPQSKKDFEEILESHYGNIIWPDAGAERILYVQCNIDERDRMAVAKIKEWKKNVVGMVSQINKTFSVQIKYFALEIEAELRSKVKSIGVANPESFFIKFERNRVVIAGERNKVDKLSDQIASSIDSLEHELDSKRLSLTQIMKLRPYELELLEVHNSIERLKDVDKKLEDKTLTLKGRKQKVDSAIRKIKSVLQDFPKQDIKDINPMICGLLKTNKTRHYVKQKMLDSKITGIWRFNEQGILQMYSKSKEECRLAVKCLHSCFRSTKLKIEADMKKYFQQEDCLPNLIKDFAGSARYKITKNELHIVTLDILLDEAFEKVKKLIDLHADTTEEFLLDPGQFRFIFSYKKKSIGDVVQHYKEMNVEIEAFDKPTRKGFHIKGERDCCKTAIAHLRSFVIDGIYRADHTVSSDKLMKFLRRSEGIHELNRIELSEKCVIRISTPDTEVVSPKLNVLSACTIGTSEVQIVKGDITEAEVDYVVNPFDTTSKHKYGIARALIDKGGYIIQKKCHDHISRIKCLHDGDTFVTSSGRLHCGGIIHVVLPTWTKDREATISNAVTRCMLEADKNAASSLALPPLGAGRFRYPNDVIADRMIRPIKRYLMENGAETSLKHVYIYDVMQESSLFLVQAMRKEIPLTIIMIPEMLTRDNDDEVNLRYLYPEIVIGSLVSQDTDVIVNTTNLELNLRFGSLSKLILEKGGDGIETELKGKHQGTLSPGEIIETGGGNLKCTAIFHGVLLKWDNDQGHSEMVLTNLVQNCLTAASKGQYESIAFPVLASGALSFPPIRVAKIMFKAINAFKEENPYSSLKTIRIVIQPAHKQALQAFEEYKELYDRQQGISKLSFIHNIQGCRPESVFVENNAADFTTKIGNVTLSIEQGDITQANTAVIVNSVREDLNLDTGRISKSILRASGRSIQFQANENREKFKKDLLVTTGSGSLCCQKILHVRARNGFDGWKRTFARSLAEVEKMSLNSVAFPALGTGGKGFPVNEMARTMIHAFQKYIRGENYQGCLKSIKIILYDAEMVDIFTQEVKAVLKSEQRMSFFFKFWESKSMEDSSSMVFHIYTDTAEAADYVKKRINKLCQEISKT